MKAFVVTFRTEKESPDRGWPIEELRKLVVRRQRGERVIDPWRFLSHRAVSLTGRVFLLLQGRHGPAVIGCGSVLGLPQMTARYTTVRKKLNEILQAYLRSLEIRSLETDEKDTTTATIGADWKA